eukprot:CAMPEP_0203952962 /NCGR_PEP_ID=MMETSP0359-20131031/86455_1 /ASSEMBLY_ACC=CAM_ASM_000338 /TAXON_ID=268821 /ORGANISM="Scrippsiella Hangoei, Strain SHTV-5" /LENGTH=270 /DNA_ID=CAMNT_0050886107 /DNA_START=408 /DNA_END=1216 /DNA_ORIENTATION=+
MQRAEAVVAASVGGQPDAEWPSPSRAQAARPLQARAPIRPAAHADHGAGPQLGLRQHLAHDVLTDVGRHEQEDRNGISQDDMPEILLHEGSSGSHGGRQSVVRHLLCDRNKLAVDLDAHSGATQSKHGLDDDAAVAATEVHEQTAGRERGYNTRASEERLNDLVLHREEAAKEGGPFVRQLVKRASELGICELADATTCSPASQARLSLADASACSSNADVVFLGDQGLQLGIGTRRRRLQRLFVPAAAAAHAGVPDADEASRDPRQHLG